MDVKCDLLGGLLQRFFQVHFGIDFSSISGGSDLETLIKTFVFSMA